MNWSARLRHFARSHPPGLIIPAGLALAYFANGLMHNLADGVVMPLIVNAFNDGPSRDLTWTIAGAHVRFANIIEDSFVLIAIVVIVYTLALRPLPTDDLTPSGIEQCPECRSNVRIGAARCPSCRTELAGAP